ncbi:MAG: beta-propeller fold lactonase family protein [Thermoanaerobaculia bacterium]
MTVLLPEIVQQPARARAWSRTGSIALFLIAGLLSAGAVLAQTPVLVIDSITHTPDPAAVVAGSTTNVVFSISVSNTATGASDDETAATLTLPLASSDLTYQDDGGGFNGLCSLVTTTVTCNLGAMQENTTKTGTLTFRVQSDAPAGTLSSTFSVVGAVDTTPDNEVEDITVAVEAEIIVDKQAPSPTDEAVPGTNVVYTVSVTNNGPSDATNVVLTDTGPGTWGSPVYTGNCVAPGCTLGTIAASSSKSATVTFAVPANHHLTQGYGDITNSASVTTDTPDSGTSDYDDSVMTPIVPKVDLSVSISNGGSTVTAGMPVSYTVTVSKTGPSALSGVLLGQGNTAISNVLSQVFTPAEGIFSASPISPNWFGLDLAGGADSATLTLSGWLNPAVTGTNFNPQVTIAPQTGVTDTNNANDTGSDTDTILRTADMRIHKTNNVDGIVQGQLVPYTITVFNAGPADVVGATVVDTFSPTFVSSATWTCALAKDLTGLGSIADGDNGGVIDGLDGASAVATSPDGKHVYVTGAADDSIAWFTRNAADGTLTFVDHIVDSGSLGLDGASAIAISPNGAQVYVSGSVESAVQVFTRDSVTGNLTALERQANGSGGVSGMASPAGLAVSPDGRHLYVAAVGSNAIVTFSRNASTGALTFVSTQTNGGGISGLGGAVAVAVAPDGRNVLVAGETDNSLAYFTRNATTGALTFLIQYVDGTATGEGLAGVTSVAFSPRGDAFYAVGAADNAVVAYSRDLTSSTGAATYLEKEVDGLNGADALGGARSVAVSPDGNLLFVAAQGEGKIGVFRRIQTPGPQTHTLDYLSNSEFASASALSMTPGGEQLYVVASAEDRLALFSETRNTTPCTVPVGSQLGFSQSTSIPAQSQVTYVASALISNSATGTLVNTASVVAPAGTTNPQSNHPAGLCPLNPGNDNQCSDSDQIGLEADLTVTKTAVESTAIPGGALTYHVTVANAGPSDVNGVHVIDSTLNVADFTSAAWACVGANGAVCDAPTSGNGNFDRTVSLPAGGSVTFTIQVVLDPGASGTPCTATPAINCEKNTASATLPSSHIDPTPGNLTSTVETPLAAQADLQIVKTVTTPLSQIDAGLPLAYQIVVRNCGPSDVTGAVVQDTFQADYENVTWSCVASNGSCPAPANGMGNLAALVDLDGGNPGDCSGAGTATFTIQGNVAVAPSSGVLTNIAKILAPAGLTDALTGNNTSSVQVALQAEADFAIIKTDGGATSSAPGSEITYSLTVLNFGPDDATGLRVEDLFPPELRDVSWTCSSEAPAKGTLVFVEDQRQNYPTDIDPVNGITGLASTRAVAVAPDSDGPGPDPGGKFVYATGYNEGALVRFLRDGETGELQYLGKVVNGSPAAVNGLGGASGLVISPDGANLYVVGETDDKVAEFSRNTGSGVVDFIEAVSQGQIQSALTVDGLDGGRDLVISPDGKHVYVTSPLQGSVAVFFRNTTQSGRLFYRQVIKAGTVPGLAGAAGLTVSPDGEHVYVAGGTTGSVSVFKRDNVPASGTFGELTFIETLTDGGTGGTRLAGASDVEISPSGDYVYVTAATDNAVSIFSRNLAAGPNFGRLTFGSEIHEGDVSGLEGAVSAKISPDADGQHLYVASVVSNAITVFRRNSATGGLSFLEVRRDGGLPEGACIQPNPCLVTSLGGAASISLDPSGTHLYVAAYADSAISAFKREGAPPAFAFAGGRPGVVDPEPVRNNVDGVEGLDGVTDLAIEGAFLYAVSFEEASVVAFDRDVLSGALTFAQRLSDGAGAEGLHGASAVAVYDESLYVVSQSINQIDNTLVVFSRDGGTGLLSFLEIHRDGAAGVSGLFGASDVAVSSDGKFVYVVGRTPGSLAVFSRNAITGALTFVESKIVNIGGIVGIQGAAGLALSSDDKHIYVAASVSDDVAVFSRNAITGQVAEIQVLPGIAALDRAIGISVSHEVTGSRNVYVTGHTANALAVFSRNVDDTSPDFGQLSLLETFTDEVDGVEGLAGARSVAVSPDGKQVYVAGENDDALAVFAREESGGGLVFVEARIDGQDGVDGIDQAYSVVVSANNLRAYVAGFGEDAIALFARTSGSRCTGAGVGNLIDEDVEIAAGGQVVYTVKARIDPAAIGELVNEAYVTNPSGAILQPTSPGNVHAPNVCVDNTGTSYPDITDNDGCRDINQLTPKSDLVLTKTDRDNVAIPGEELTYFITVENEGPSNVVGATVTDVLTSVFPAGASWTCLAAPSGSLTFADAVFDGIAGIEGLGGASAVAVSPDGLHVYATAQGDDAVAAFALNPTTGALTQIDLEVQGIAGVTGLDGASAVLVSPDGGSVYVAGRISDAIAVFTRNAVTGELTFLEVQQGPGVAGLDAPVGLAMDALGDSLYVAAANSNAVTVFDRNPATGALTFLEMQQDGSGAVDGLAGASSVAVSVDGLHVYATGENDSAIAVFGRDTGTGALTYLQSKFDGVGGTDGLSGARSVAVSPDDLNVYVAGSGENAIAVFSRTPVLGTLTFRQVVRDGVGGVDGLAGVTAVAVTEDSGYGFHVYAIGAAENAISILSRDAADFGKLTYFAVEKDGFGANAGLDGASGIAITVASDWVLATGAVDSAVAVFSRPTDSSCSGGSDFLADPEIMLEDTVSVAAGSRIVYEVTGVVDSAICTTYPCTATLQNDATVTSPVGNELDPGDNGDSDIDALSPRANLSITKTDNISVIQGLAGASAVVVSPDGLNAYATGLIGDGIAAFARSLVDGSLTFLESELDGVDGVDGLNGAAAVVVSLDGAHVYVAGSADNALVVFERDPADGRLVHLQKLQNGFGGVTGLLGPDGLAMSGDQKHLYVAAANSSTVAIFAREVDDLDPDFGRLTFLGEVRDGVGGVDGLSLARALVLSPDGEHLYVAGEADNALAVFRRNAGTGLLTYIQMKQEGVGGVAGVAGARGVAISPDGKDVYVSGGTSNAVAHFVRNTASASADFGKVTWQSALVDGLGGVDGIQGPAGLVLAPDPPGGDPGGQHLYVAGRGENALAVFERDAGTGALTFVAAARQGQAGFDGLGESSFVALSPDGTNVYSTGATAGAVVTSARDWDSGALTGTGDLTYVENDRQGDGTAAPGQLVQYEIVVTNHGPSTVFGAVVTDIFPGELEDVAWVCNVIVPGPTPGAACLGGAVGTGDLVRPLRLPPGGVIRYEAQGTIKPGVTGAVINTATVTEPLGFIELDPSDNSATDDDTLLARVADLSVTKYACTDPLDCFNTQTLDLEPGSPTHYEIRVENLGPSDVQGAVVRDLLPEVFANARWTCEASPVPGLLAPLPLQPSIADGDPVPDAQPLCGPPVPLAGGLDGARAVDVTTDGLNVYVASGAGNSVTSFRRDLRNGELQFVGRAYDGQTTYDVGCTPAGLIDGLLGASAVVSSADGKHVYVAAELDDAVSVYQRLAGTGALKFLQFRRDGVGGVNGLGNARGLALSGDGKHLYTAARSDNGVGIFVRDAATGLLTYSSIRVDGAPQPPLTIDGLAGAVAVTVSPDGTSVYVAGEIDDAVAVFSRNATTGGLTYVEVKKDGQGGVDGLDGARALALSGDGKHLYAVGAVDNAIAVFSRNGTTGGLTFVEAQVDGVGGADGLAGASGVRVSADGEHVYVTGESSSAIAVFARDAVTGALTPLSPAVDGVDGVEGLGGAFGLALSPDDEHVYGAGRAADSLSLLHRGSGSRCTPLGFGDIIDTVDLTSGGELVYALTADLAPAASGMVDNVATVEAPGDTSDDALSNNEDIHHGTLKPAVNLTVTKTDFQTEAVPGLPVAYTITVTNNGPSDLNDAVVEDLFPAIYGDPAWSCMATDALAFVDIERQGVDGVDGLTGPYGVAVAPDPDGLFGPEVGGQHVYVASRTSQAIDLFERDLGTGELLYVTKYVDGVGGFDGFGGAGGIAISPDGKQVYATGATDDAVAVLDRDVVSGALTLASVNRDTDPGVDGLDGAAVVTVSRDGRNVYVGGQYDDAIVVFARNTTTGALTFLERWKDGFGGLELGVLDRPSSIVATKDGRQVIVAAADGDRISIFNRNPDTGRLSFTQVLQDGVGGVDGIDLVQSLTMSAGGKFLYAAGLADDAIAIFERDIVTGVFSYLGQAKNGVGGVTGLDGVRAVTVSSDGIFLFAASYNDDAVAIFRRDGLTGLLIQLQLAQDGFGAVDGLNGARALALDPTGRDLYILGEHDNAVSVLARVGQGSCFSPGEGDLVSSVNLAVGATATFMTLGTVDPAATGQLINTVTVTMPPGTTNNGDTEATDIDTLTPVADLAVTKDDGVTSVSPGTTTIYQITAVNPGPSNAPASLLDDVLPPEILSATWTCQGSGGGVCASGGSGSLAEAVDIPAGGTVVFTLAAQIDPNVTGTLTNTATITPAVGVGDPQLGNNSATDVDNLVPISDLALQKVVDTAVVEIGDPIEFTLTVTNIGPAMATGVSVVDLLPAGTNVTGVVAPGWSCVSVPGSVTCDLATIPFGSSPAPIVISADAPTTPGSYVNAATVTSSSGDPVAPNNSATAPFSVVAIEPPTVTVLDSVPDTGDGEVETMETAEVAIEDLVVTFTEEMFDPPGDGDPADVTNPANYALVEAGTDGHFSGSSCDPVSGDDIAVTVDSVVYNSGPSTAFVTVRNGTGLTQGLYRFSVCSPGVEDLDGNPLDGNGDLVPGDDFIRFFRVQLTNLIQRPEADFPSDLGAWTIGGAPAGDFSVDSVDADGFPLSGSFRIVNTSGATNPGLSQCIDLAPSPGDLYVTGRIRIDGAGTTTTAKVLVNAAGGSCLSPSTVLATWESPVVSGSTSGQFVAASALISSIPPTATTLIVRNLAVNGPGLAIDTRFDRTTVESVLFFDGFETGDLSRWDGFVP